MDLESLQHLGLTDSDVTALFPVILCFCGARKHPFYNTELVLHLSGFIMIGTLITSEMGIFNMPAYHLLAAVEVILLYEFYARITSYSKRGGPRRWVTVLLVILFIQPVFIEPLEQFNSFARTFGILFLLCLGLSYLYKYMMIWRTFICPPIPYLLLTPDFIYFAGSLFTYIFWVPRILSEEAKRILSQWLGDQSVSTIVKNTIAGYGFMAGETAVNDLMTCCWALPPC